MVLEIWREAIDTLEGNLKGWLIDAFNKYKDEAVQLNKKQLSEGKKRTGESLSPYSTPYLSVRRKFGRPESPKDLNLQGGFTKGIYAAALTDYFEVGSDDWKELILEHNHGEILGIPDDELDEFLEKYIWPYVGQRFIENFR